MIYLELEIGVMTSRGYTSDFAEETRASTRNVTGQKVDFTRSTVYKLLYDVHRMT